MNQIHHVYHSTLLYSLANKIGSKGESQECQYTCISSIISMSFLPKKRSKCLKVPPQSLEQQYLLTLSFPVSKGLERTSCLFSMLSLILDTDVLNKWLSNQIIFLFPFFTNTTLGDRNRCNAHKRNVSGISQSSFASC